MSTARRPSALDEYSGVKNRQHQSCAHMSSLDAEGQGPPPLTTRSRMRAHAMGSNVSAEASDVTFLGRFEYFRLMYDLKHLGQ